MSSPSRAPSNGADTAVKASEGKNKNKEKSTDLDAHMQEEEEEDDDDDAADDDDDDLDEEEEEDEGMDDEEEDEEEDLDEINPSAILSGARRTRGIKVDYNSKEALQKAGLYDKGDAEMKE